MAFFHSITCYFPHFVSDVVVCVCFNLCVCVCVCEEADLIAVVAEEEEGGEGERQLGRLNHAQSATQKF